MAASPQPTDGSKTNSPHLKDTGEPMDWYTTGSSIGWKRVDAVGTQTRYLQEDMFLEEKGKHAYLWIHVDRIPIRIRCDHKKTACLVKDKLWTHLRKLLLTLLTRVEFYFKAQRFDFQVFRYRFHFGKPPEAHSHE